MQFAEGCIKTYDMRPLFERIPSFAARRINHLFFGVTIGVGGYGAVWNDDLDLSSDEHWENGVDE